MANIAGSGSSYIPSVTNRRHLVRWYVTRTDIEDRKQAEDKLDRMSVSSAGSRMRSRDDVLSHETDDTDLRKRAVA